MAMTRALVMITAVGLALAVFCFCVSGAFGGFAWGPSGVNWKMGHAWASHWVHVDVDDGDSGPRISRDLPWTGGDRLVVDAPADVDYTQGPVAKVTVSGPKALVDHVVIEDGRITMRGDSWSMGSLKVVMTAPNVTSFETNGSQDLSIAGYRQDQLHIALNGSGSVVAKGEAAHADLRIAGSGDADLGGLTGDEAKVRISGSGDATIAPKVTAEVDVSGSGDVTLLTHPANVQSNISGSGSLNQTSEPAPPQAPRTPGAKA
jgi:hypothetical protein